MASPGRWRGWGDNGEDSITRGPFGKAANVEKGATLKAEVRNAARAGSRAEVLLLFGAFLLRGVFLAFALPYGEPLDEPFHLGYAEYLSSIGWPPALGAPSLPADVLRPFVYLPHSVAFAPRISWRGFEALALDERSSRRRAAFSPDAAASRAFVGPNYEAQQPPVAYVPAAITLRALRSARTDRRLLLLRLEAAVFAAIAVPLVFLFFRRLLGRRAALAAAAAFVAFPGVGWWVGRWTNDAIALPIAAGLLVILADTARGRLSNRLAASLALLLALGCWVKLYFLLFLPAAPLVALLAPCSRRGALLRRSVVASASAFALAVPWLLHQRVATGDWFGLLPTRQAVAAGVGLIERGRAITDLLSPRFAIVFARTFLWPGTWGAMGAPATLAVLLAGALAALAMGPWIAGAGRSRLRCRVWRSAAVVLLLFAGGYLAYATTFAAVARHGGYRPSAGPDGWYLLLLFPVILTAGCAGGRRLSVRALLIAASLFLAADFLLTFGVVPAVYAGWVKPNGANASWRTWLPMAASPERALRFYHRVGLALVPGVLLGGLYAAMLACLVAGAWTLCRTRGSASRPLPAAAASERQ